jgi:hypothetical protein
VNDYYGTKFTDKVAHFADDMKRRMTGKRVLVWVFDPTINPSKERRKMAFDPFFGDMLSRYDR